MSDRDHELLVANIRLNLNSADFENMSREQLIHLLTTIRILVRVPWCGCGHTQADHGASIIDGDYALVCGFCGVCERGAERGTE